MFTGPAGSRALLAKNYTNGYICKPSAGYGALQKKCPLMDNYILASLAKHTKPKFIGVAQGHMQKHRDSLPQAVF